MAWSLFLPLGARFSVDAWRRSPSPEPVGPLHASIAVFGMLLQLSAMHLYAAIRQAGATWQDGTAVYYALRQTLWVTDLGAWIGQNVPIADLRTASFLYRALEVFIGVLVLVPFAFARRVSIAVLVGFHLGSRFLWNVGAYEWVMLGAVPLLVSSRDWTALEAWYRATIGRWLGTITVARHAAVAPAFAFDDSARRSLSRAVTAAREGAAFAFLVVCGVALARDMGDERVPSGPEAVVYRVVAYPRLFQRWGLFAPDPAKRPGTLVAEAKTASGATLDPLSEKGMPERPDPLMAAYFTSIGQSSRSVYVSELREYVRRVGDLRSPSDKLVWFNVDWIEAPIASPEPQADVVALSPVSRRITSGP
jgi:hypothetical protein